MAEKQLQYELERKAAISDLLYLTMKLKNPYGKAINFHFSKLSKT